MILPVQTFTTMLETMSAGLQGRAAQLINLSVGSVLRALLEANASIAMWLQWLVLQVLSMTRASTSVGSDLDSWMADFSFSRLPGSASSGLVTFTRFTPNLTALIPAGTAVLTTDGSLQFVVVADASSPYWQPKTSSYTLAADVVSITVPVQATLVGSAGNILAGTIGLLGNALPGVDQVSNLSSFGGGVGPENDASFRARFQTYINSRSLATIGAVESVVMALQQGIRYCVLENVHLDGTVALGNFCVIVDDGTGMASPALLAAVSGAVDSVRPIGTTFSVAAASVLAVTVQMTLSVTSSTAASATGFAVQQAVSSWIQGLPMGGLISISKLEALAHGVGTAVVSVSTTLVNGEAADLQATESTVFVVSAINVSASQV